MKELSPYIPATLGIFPSSNMLQGHSGFEGLKSITLSLRYETGYKNQNLRLVESCKNVRDMHLPISRGTQNKLAFMSFETAHC